MTIGKMSVRKINGGLAQLVERLHGMQKVSGSTPLTSTQKGLWIHFHRLFCILSIAIAQDPSYICYSIPTNMGIFKQMAEYLYLKKKDPNEPRTQWMKYMHGMNRISLLMFIAAVLIILFKLVILPWIRSK